MTMNEHMAGYPVWVQVWLLIMMVTVILAIPFAIKDWRARWVLLSMIANMVVMQILFTKFGFTRILGLAHVLFWTPLAIYLWRNRSKKPERIWTGRYVKLALTVILISLAFDYADVIRYVLGERAVVSYP